MQKEWDKKLILGRELKVARVRVGLTQTELAKKLNKPQSFVHIYETGERRLDVLEFLQLCKILNADPYDIIKTIEK